MPEMNPAQKIPHPNLQQRRTIFRNNKRAHTFQQGERREGKSQC
jgi:hypothetical protein